MIICKQKDKVWINTSEGVTVYFDFYLPSKKINKKDSKVILYGSVNTPCGISKVHTYKMFDSREDAERQISILTQDDANKVFEVVRNWSSSRPFDLEYYLEVSYRKPKVEFGVCMH